MLTPLQDPFSLIALSVVFGLVIGSFLNVVIHRLPKMMERDWHAQCAVLRDEAVPDIETLTLAAPRSRCPHCGHAISAIENIPLLSYLFLKGRCRECKNPISLRYPLVELLTAALFGLAVWRFGYSAMALGAMLFCALAITLTFIDFDTQLLPDDLTLPLLWAGLLFNLWGTYTNLASAVIGAVAGYLSLWSVYWGFKLFTGKEGMGYGDFKLLAAIGAWVGWQVLPLTPTGYGDSPYQCFSAFAGNPYLVSPELLLKDHLLTTDDLADMPSWEQSKVDFGELLICC